MHLDIERYRTYVDHFDMSEERKVELIHIVGRIMASFVDRAFGEASEQILQGITHGGDADRGRDPLDSDANLLSTFNDAADEDTAGKRWP